MWLVGLMKPYAHKILFSTLLIVLANLADLTKPRIYAIIIDDFLKNGGNPDGNFITSSLTNLGISYFAVIFVSAVCSLWQSRIITRICQKILHETRMNTRFCAVSMDLESIPETRASSSAMPSLSTTPAIRSEPNLRIRSSSREI